MDNVLRFLLNKTAYKISNIERIIWVGNITVKYNPENTKEDEILKNFYESYQKC